MERATFIDEKNLMDSTKWKHVICNGKIVIYARITKTPTFFRFETNTNKGKYVINVNMPRFYTYDDAVSWIDRQNDWTRV